MNTNGACKEHCTPTSRISLDGDWTLRHFAEEDRIHHPDQLPEGRGIPAQVPGNVELDLVRAGEIPDPFVGRNIRNLRALETREWWYTRTFDAPAEPAGAWDLVFDGLDTLATVWLNGVEAGRSDNMLIQHRFDVTAALKPGAANRIDVRLSSATLHARRFIQDAHCLSWEGREEAVYIRKAPHVYGWDIMPRAVSAGIWRPVWLEPRPAEAFEQIYYWTCAAGPSEAVLGVRFQFRTAARDLEGYSVRFRGVCGDHTFDHEVPVEFVAGGCRIPVADPQLWWPKGYGAPNLYTVTVQTLCHGKVLAERTDRIGLRVVRIDRTEQAGPRWMPGPKGKTVARFDDAPDPEAHFVIYVNDTPIMAKGTNWVPLDAFHSRDAERLDKALALCGDLGCNMIRCWGGNVYEGHRFFDLCDEKGILVWQDFSFACCRYPQDEAFLTRARAEAETVVDTLRNHPSLALWCGDNEIDLCYLNDGLSPEQNRLSREVLPQAVHRRDPWRHYVPSSSYYPPGVDGEPPEQHLWGPRGYYKSPYYTHHNAHFIGEIGYHGCPNVSSIRRFIAEEDLWPWQDNAAWRVHDVTHHAANPGRNRIKLMANQIREMFGTIPDDLETFALASQIVQAEAKKFFVESTRLRKWRTSGILWWNVLDGWPQFSDAVVDYYFGKKLAYHYLRRSQSPVCVIIGEAGTEKYLPVVVCNDTRDDAETTCRVWDADSGDVLAETAFRSPANENWQVARIRTHAADQRLLLIEWQVDGEVSGNHYLVGTPAHSLDRYRGWLPQIAALPRAFDAAAVAR